MVKIYKAPRARKDITLDQVKKIKKKETGNKYNISKY